MKKAEEYVHQLESSGILMNQQMTFPEYAEQLCKFQDIVCRMIAGSDYSCPIFTFLCVKPREHFISKLIGSGHEDRCP